MMKNANETVTSCGGNITRCGYAYLASAAEIVARRGDYPHGKLGREVYAQVAAIHGSEKKRVSRDLARAVEDIWLHGDREMLETILRHKAVTKPSPGEMILALAIFIADGEKTII